MITTASRFVDAVPWETLEHAYGPASDLPPLLEKATAAKGRTLYEILGELCSRVLHQGTIYNASPPVVGVLIEMLPDAEPREKAMLYGLLAAFADSARMAIEDGPAPPSCAGGTPEDGAAIRKELVDARRVFELDLAQPNAQIRAQTAELLTAFADADRASANLVRDRYRTEDELQVRYTILHGLTRIRTSFDDWPDFLTAALDRESDPANRFLIRGAQVRELGSGADATCVDELVSTFAQAYGTHEYLLSSDEPFFEAVHLLGTDRELAALLKAFDLASDLDLVRILATRLLRLAFDDHRTGWGETAYSRLNEDGSQPPQMDIASMALRAVGTLILYKLFPFVMRWRVRRKLRGKQKGIRRIEYYGVQGAAPEIPRKLSEMQRTVLTAFAAKSELWEFRTNLWELFSLPDTAEGLRSFVADR
jgi:hypothetical protein